MTYTERTGQPKGRFEFLEVVSVFRDGGLKVYHACAYHADEIIREESKANQEAAKPPEEGGVGAPRIARWHKVPPAFPGRRTEYDCFICYQFDYADEPVTDGQVELIGRVPTETKVVKK